MRTPGKAKTEKLKKMLRERRLLEAQQRADDRQVLEALLHNSFSPPIKEKEPDPAPSKKEMPETLQGPAPVSEIPDTLKGYSLAEILLMETDNLLTDQEKSFLKTRKRLREQRYIPSQVRKWRH